MNNGWEVSRRKRTGMFLRYQTKSCADADMEGACSYVTELLYIHSKVMIVDDRRVIVGVLKRTKETTWLTCLLQRAV